VTTYETVLFDSDGVLVEPPDRETQARATRDAFRSVGVGDPNPGHVDAVVDGIAVETLMNLCREYDLEPEAFWAAREHHDEQSQLADFRAGRRSRYDDVSVVADLPGSRGIVSNNHHSTIEFVLEHFDLGPLFETAYGRPKTIESLTRKKPDTYYLDKALTDLDANAGLYVGDSESDVVGAHRAGLDSVFVRRAHNDGVELEVEPTYEVESLAALSNIIRSVG
jgi:HAD superfamily hydrolase (TIGR01549 family)